MHPNTHICSLCTKIFNSEEQWKAHSGGKKHKRNYELALKGKVPAQELIISTNNNVIDEDIQKLREKGTTIPKIVNKVIKCQKIRGHSAEMDTSTMTELLEPCVLMEGEKILAIYVDKFFSSEKCEKYYNLLECIYEHRGFVERGQEKAGGNMVMCGWRLDSFIDNIVMYAQSNRTNHDKKPFAKEIHNLGKLFTKDVYKLLQPQFTSWIQLLENLYPTTIPRKYGRIGDAPFSHLGITKNYWVPAHTDKTDTSMGFIMWFTREYPHGILKRGGEFCLPEYGYYIKPKAGSVLLLDSKDVSHGTLANSGFSQMGVDLLTKKSTLNSFERITLEIDEIRRSKNKSNKHLYDNFLGNSKLKKN